MNCINAESFLSEVWLGRNATVINEATRAIFRKAVNDKDNVSIGSSKDTPMLADLMTMWTLASLGCLENIHKTFSLCPSIPLSVVYMSDREYPLEGLLGLLRESPMFKEHEPNGNAREWLGFCVKDRRIVLDCGLSVFATRKLSSLWGTRIVGAVYDMGKKEPEYILEGLVRNTVHDHIGKVVEIPRWS